MMLRGLGVAAAVAAVPPFRLFLSPPAVELLTGVSSEGLRSRGFDPRVSALCANFVPLEKNCVRAASSSEHEGKFFVYVLGIH